VSGFLQDLEIDGILLDAKLLQRRVNGLGDASRLLSAFRLHLTTLHSRQAPEALY
jgi:hypothetical protein